MHNTKRVGLIALVAMLAIGATAADAQTLGWDRNATTTVAATNTTDYRVYGCFTVGCTVLRTDAMLQGAPVLQPASGVVPSMVLDLAGRVGSLAVTARNAALVESGLSVALGFDLRTPSIPQNLRLLP